ncbi:MAG: transketolase [Ignavibacteriales bacterium]|nr:transketolase [Ignavibacteriales bacterium]
MAKATAADTNIDLDLLCINTIRTLAMDAVQKAKSGHPGLPMGAAPMAYVLWTRYLKHNPANPKWPNRDRFILSAGHGCMLLYSLLHLTGYDLSLDDIKNFRQWGSKTPGHPESHLTPGVETTTGPLGQGFANGVGMAMAKKYLAARYNRENFEIINYKIYGIVSDGDLMEGVASEAASLAGHLRLGNIIYLYDDNHISIDGSTDLSFTEDVVKRFEGYRWHVRTVEDGNDLEAIDAAIKEAIAETDHPSLIKVRTHIGFGSPNKQDTAEAHGSPLGEEEVKLTKQQLGWDPERQFYIPEQALAHFRKSANLGNKWEQLWKTQFGEYKKNHPDLAAEVERVWANDFGNAWKKALLTFGPESAAMGTREASGKVLNAIAPHLPTLIGGSADLTPSNNTYLKDMGEFQAGNYKGRNLRFGVREHAMGSLLNGIALTDGMIPYGGTFLLFYDYMRPPVRLAAIMGIRPILVYTHDSIGLGEDGPTHQPVEQLSGLRSVPNITVIRPADGNEVSVAWRVAIEHKDGPVALILTRQKIPVIDRTKYAPAGGLEKGAYVLTENSMTPEILLVGSGSEVHLVLGAYEKLAASGKTARVVSMPSWELFDRQPKEYRDKVFPPFIKKRIAVEAALPLGWTKYVGPTGTIVGVTRYGASAPGDVNMKEYGFTVDNIVQKANELLAG